jgi:hypothetical protein
MAEVLVENLSAGGGRWVAEMSAELSAAQAEVFGRMVARLADRS